MSRSLRAKGVSGILSLKPKTSENRRNKEINKILNKGEKVSQPSIILKTRYVDNSNGRIFYANEESQSKTIVIYIHGGAYCADFIPFHWSFLKKIVRDTDVKIIAPAYRLVPFGTYKNAFDLIIPIYKDCIRMYDKVILMGDSAGGGLALSLTLYFKFNKIKLPDELILLSPWVDVAMDNPEIKGYENKDPMLTVDGLRMAVKPWLGNISEHNWRVSPINGDVTGINNVTIFVGTREIFYPDIVKLYNKLDHNLNNELIVGEDMNHAYPLIPIPESREAISKIVEIIKR